MTDSNETTLINRTLSRFFPALRDIGPRSRKSLAGAIAPDLPDRDLDRLRDAMRDCLEGKGGQASARARAADLGHVYLALSAEGRHRFLRLLATEFDIDQTAVDDAMAAVAAANDPIDRRAKLEDLRRSLRPARINLLSQFNILSDGTKFLVELRASLQMLQDEDPELRGLADDLKGLLTSWFDVGFLELVRIDWTSPADLLERLIAYEAVHEIQSWADLKNRLDSDRRCFAFMHPNMPNEPLIFVEVALVNGMADDVRELLDESRPPIDPTTADAAIFYSISNAQRGLAGISLGDFLIKRVVEALRGEFPNLKTFATLSPIPGFRRWLDRTLAEPDGKLISPENARILDSVLDQRWADSPDQAAALREPLSRLCAHYLLRAKRGDRSLDPVAHFHLTNGARLERLNWLGDVSDKGLRQSAGMMVNYLYRPNDIETNHEAYTGRGRIACAPQVKNLLKT